MSSGNGCDFAESMSNDEESDFVQSMRSHKRSLTVYSLGAVIRGPCTVYDQSLGI